VSGNRTAGNHDGRMVETRDRCPRNPGLGLAEVQARKGLEALVEVRPTKSSGPD
jgi:hypothetical protein